jgi:hypothetical protein
MTTRIDDLDASPLAAARAASLAALRAAWSAATRVETLRRGPARHRRSLRAAEEAVEDAGRALTAARELERDLAARNASAPNASDEDPQDG